LRRSTGMEDLLTMAADDHAHVPAFSRPLAVADVPAAGMPMTIAAEPAEREILAREFGLVAIERLEANVDVRPEGGHGAHGLEAVRVVGTMRARIRQICVVSLEPFDSDVVEPFDLHCLPRAAPVRPTGLRRTIVVEPFEPREDAEAIVDGKIDLGQIAAEFLALGLDPHPRKPGVEFQFPADGPAVEESPFSILQGLKRRDE
jgi:hypothetical protein